VGLLLKTYAPCSEEGVVVRLMALRSRTSRDNSLDDGTSVGAAEIFRFICHQLLNKKRALIEHPFLSRTTAAV
jgi:hypothetical protein